MKTLWRQYFFQCPICQEKDYVNGKSWDTQSKKYMCGPCAKWGILLKEPP